MPPPRFARRGRQGLYVSRDLLAAFIARRTAVRKHVRPELTKIYRADFEAKSNPVTVDAARVRLEAASMIPNILRQPFGPGGAIASRASTQPGTPSTDRAAYPLYLAARERQSDEDDEAEATEIPLFKLPRYDGRSAEEIMSDNPPRRRLRRRTRLECDRPAYVSGFTRQKHGRGRHTWNVYSIVLDKTRVLGRVP